MNKLEKTGKKHLMFSMNKSLYMKMFKAYQLPSILIGIKNNSSNPKKIDISLLDANESFYNTFNHKLKLKENPEKINHFIAEFENIKPLDLQNVLISCEIREIYSYNHKHEKNYKIRIVPLEENQVMMEFNTRVDDLIKSWENQVVEGDNIFTWILDKNLKFSFVSHSVEKILGFSPDELIHKDIKTIFTIESRKILYERFSKRNSEWDKSKNLQAISTSEYRIGKKNKEVIWVEIIAKPILDEQTNITGFIGFGRDINTKKNIEYRLISNERMYRNIANILPEIIFTIDSDLNLSYLNQTAFHFFKHVKLPESRTINLRDIKSIVNFEKVKTNIERAFKGLDVKHNMIKLKMEDSNSYFEIHYNPVHEYEKIISLVCVAIDITKQKKIEKELTLARKKVREVNKLKSAFLSNISHEIRTPMNSILGYTQLLLRRIKGKTEHGYLQTIRTHSLKLLNLLSDIIDLSKIDSGQLEILGSNHSVNIIMDEIETEFRSHIKAQKKDIRLIILKSLKDSESHFIIDELRLKQVLNNLFMNSLKFTDKGFIEIGYQLSDDDTLVFHISDSGIGLSNEKRKVIFERFKQANAEISAKYGGAGLGLAIAKGIVEAIDGKIWVESDWGKGATFIFTIPVKRT